MSAAIWTAMSTALPTALPTALSTAVRRRFLLYLVSPTVKAVHEAVQEWDELTASLDEDDFRDFFEEFVAVLGDDEVRAAAGELRPFLTRRRHRRAARRGEPELDVTVAERLAFLHWYRYLYLPEGVTDDELPFVISLFRKLHAAHRRIPVLLVPLFDPDIEEPGGDVEDVHTLTSCARDLFAFAEAGDDGGGYRDHAVALARRAMAISDRLGAIDPDIRIELASVLLTTFEHTQDAGVLDHSVARARRALAGTPPDDAGRLGRVATDVLLAEADHLHALGDLSGMPELRSAIGDLLGRLDPGTPDHDRLRLASVSLLVAQRLLGGDRVEARELASFREVFETVTALDPIERASLLATLFISLVAHGKQTGDRRLLDGCVELLTEGLRSFPDGSAERQLLRVNLGSALVHRFCHAADRAGLDRRDLDRAATLLGVRPPDLPGDGERNTDLADVDPRLGEPHEDEDVQVLVRCATELFDYADGDASRRPYREYAVALARRALQVSGRLDEIAPETRADLAVALWTTFDHTQDTVLLDHALANARTALADTPPGQEEWLDRVGVLGHVLLETAEAGNDEEALQESLRLLRPAVYGADPHHPHLVRAASALVRAVFLIYSQSHSDPVMDDAVLELRRLMGLIPEDTPGRDAMVAAALGTEVSRQVLHLLTRGDLNAVRELGPMLDDMLGYLEPGTPEHEALRVLSASLPVMGNLMRDVLSDGRMSERDLARYVEVLKGATALDPVERADQLQTLTGLLIAQEELTGDRALLEECAGLLTEALGTLPDDSAEHRLLGAYLGWVLLRRFRHTGDRIDLDRASALLRRRPADPSGTGAERSATASDLGTALREHYLLTGDDRSYQEAMALLRSSVIDPGSVLVSRLGDARAGGDLAAKAGRWDEAADMFAHGIALTPQLAWLGLSRVDQEQNLIVWSGMVNEAAAAAVRAGDPPRAIEVLEQGRAVLFHQTLDIRSDTARVRVQLPGPADRLAEIGEEIDRAEDRDRRRALARDWDHLVAEIRSHPGRDGFLRPPGFPALRPAPGQTVVPVNVADFGSDAFLVTAAGVRVVPLPSLTSEDVRNRVTAFHQALAERARASNALERRAATDVIEDVLDWLWRTTAEPVLDALGYLEEPAEGTPWPHVHWCPTWMLGFLPLHAAGARRPAEPGAAVLDRVVSSYTLSLRTLRFANQHRDPPPDLRSLLVVSLPDTPGLPPLRGARREAAMLAGLPGRTHVLTGERAVHREVSRAVRDHAWAHFACHAAPDLQNPSRGRLFLHDHQTDPFTVLDISRLRLEHARFAFLSACDTARGGLLLPDEALHLGGALQLAGYQHVIATLWQINDTIAATVSERVHGLLRTPDDPILEPARAATALHEAIRSLRRRYPDDPAIWASYVHFGP